MLGLSVANRLQLRERYKAILKNRLSFITDFTYFSLDLLLLFCDAHGHYFQIGLHAGNDQFRDRFIFCLLFQVIGPRALGFAKVRILVNHQRAACIPPLAILLKHLLHHLGMLLAHIRCFRRVFNDIAQHQILFHRVIHRQAPLFVDTKSAKFVVIRTDVAAMLLVLRGRISPASLVVKHRTPFPWRIRILQQRQQACAIQR